MAFRKPLSWADHQFPLNVNIGIAVKSRPDEDTGDLLTNAELAIGVAQQQGQNSYRFYSKELYNEVVERISLETALGTAIKRQEFILHYQPKMKLNTNRLSGVEALIRWQHHKLGLLSPFKFIHLAEQNGMIIELGDWVLDAICRELDQWQKKGVSSPQVAVNISGKQLDDEGFIERVEGTLERFGINGSHFEFELTETILIDNPKRTAKLLQKLKTLGIEISIDDFGTGYSSFSYLNNLPFDKIKIDRAFIRDVTSDKQTAAIATSMINMAHSLGAKVVAEGVENREQLQFLRDNGCDEIQGFYFSKPLPPELLVSFMRY